MKRIGNYTARIEDSLKQIPFRAEPSSLYEPCRYVLEGGGKRFRPLLTLLGAGLCSGDPDEAMPAALAVELIHNFTLVHDDIMDGADSRRGRPSVHRKWDMPTAILAGDLLYAEAFSQLSVYGGVSAEPISSPDGARTHEEVISGSRTASPSAGACKPYQNVGDSTLAHIATLRYARLNQTLIHAIRTVCEGQALDMDLERTGDVTLEAYLKMIGGKTSALISGALAMGAIVASARTDQVDLLNRLGHHIGLAFQMQDDLLDVTADPDKFGKIRGGDILEGKKTCLYVIARQNGSPAQREDLYNKVHLQQISKNDVDQVIALYEETGALEAAAERVERSYSQAVELTEQFDDSVYKEDLLTLLNFLHKRDH